MRGFADVVMLLHFVSAMRLRRHLLRHHPGALEKTIAAMLSSRLLIWLPLPRWWNEAVLLQHATLFELDAFPVEIFADDKVFSTVKNMRRGIVVALYAFVLGLAISTF